MRSLRVAGVGELEEKGVVETFEAIEEAGVSEAVSERHLVCGLMEWAVEVTEVFKLLRVLDVLDLTRDLEPVEYRSVEKCSSSTRRQATRQSCSLQLMCSSRIRLRWR